MVTGARQKHPGNLIHSTVALTRWSCEVGWGHRCFFLRFLGSARMQLSEPGKKSVLRALESWDSMEDMLRVFQNMLLKWFGEEAGLTRETGTTQYFGLGILGGGEGRATPGVWKQPRVGFCCLQHLVTLWRYHRTGATGFVIGNLSIPCAGGFICFPSTTKLAAGVGWRRLQWGPVCGISISLLTRMRAMDLSWFDTFLTSFESW